MTTRTFTTRTGIRKRTGTERRFVVVDDRDGEIVFRTDDRHKAEKRAERPHGARGWISIHHEVIDLG